MRGKKRPKKAIASRPPDPSEKIAQGDHCIYCGNTLSANRPPFLATAHTRSFPACSEACRAGAEDYVAQDKRKKKFLYGLLFFCAMGILAAALFQTITFVMYLSVIVAGVSFFLFPYPISSFETFLGCPIKRVVLICRIVGVFFALFGAFLLVVTFFA